MTPTYRSHSISIGSLTLGGVAPVRIQSMTNTDTNDVDASVEQCRRMISAGASLVRLTTQGKREVQNLAVVRNRLRSEGLETPVVADIHFKPGLALEAARVVDKIRINPGNYLKGNTIDATLSELISVCKEEGCAMRIGVNHGSLNESILNSYGDTPEGMVESAMQFLRVCQKHNFDRVVVSMKSSNPRVMVQSVRLLVWKMTHENMSYPLHLGVTEAGDGPEGRIKSAVGMAPLLLEGMGDTLRVSLTEAPENEMPVARILTGLFPKPGQLPYSPFQNLAWDPFSFQRRKAGSLKIISRIPPDPSSDLRPGDIEALAVPFETWEKDPESLRPEDTYLLLERNQQSVQEVKYRLNRFCQENRTSHVLYKTVHHTDDPSLFMMQLAGELGFLLIDGALDAVWVDHPKMETEQINDILLMILQAAGARISKTEYIACPSCGRTQFDILSRLKEIREATSHLPDLKIGVMGCIVNGPGEMADAHYGYVGAGPGKVSLYKGKEAVRKNIPEHKALQALIELMKQEGDWLDP
ncbi:MAG: (E)-4-hydroxy-3-methylbut-2-enyl-diphosphate synthase [Bacteroidota bacterium]